VGILAVFRHPVLGLHQRRTFAISLPNHSVETLPWAGYQQELQAFWRVPIPLRTLSADFYSRRQPMMLCLPLANVQRGLLRGTQSKMVRLRAN
jgi:hypothetical protein